jgi:hypothetical protein
MNQISEIHQRISFWALALFLAASIICLVMGWKDVGKGLVLGVLFSVINFTIMAKLISIQFGRGKRAATMISFGSLSGRYLILAIPLIVSLKSTSISFAATMVGIFAIQIVILLENLVIKKYI